MSATPKKPKGPTPPSIRRRPVSVNSYFRNGKRVVAYKRRNAGDANTK